MTLNKAFFLKPGFPQVACLFIALSTAFSLFGSSPQQSENEPFNAGKVIMGHIVNSYEWHLFGHTGIPLPVILYHPDRGWTCFLSSQFEEGTYKGYALRYLQETSMAPSIVAVDEQGKTNREATSKIWDFSITKNVAALFFSVILLMFLFIPIAKTYMKKGVSKPSGFTSLMEPLILFVRDDIARATIDEKRYHRYMPFLLTVFFFIFINNLLGLIPLFPGGVNLTGNLSITGTLAIFTLIITSFSGNKNYWRHIFAMPGVPLGVLFILTPIEILGIFLKPFVLMMRLFANMAAGHIIVLSFICLIFVFTEINVGAGLGVSVMSVFFSVFILLLDVLVAFIQAYVFTFLSALYFGAATEVSNEH